MNRFLGILTFAFLLISFSLQGCSQKSYPSSKIKESLVKICREEYGIENIDVKTADDTIAVYLPLPQLFPSDFKETAVTGKVRNLETLFEPSPEALEKVQDVLFSISRVLLSTDRPFRFYILEATDVEKTGMQLVLSGYVDDIKRLRIWDISRNEYNKRVVHEFRLNHAVLWHKPVRQFINDLKNLSAEELHKKHFGAAIPMEMLRSLFFNNLWSGNLQDPYPVWEILDIRSAAIQKNQVLVYTKLKTVLTDTKPKGELTELQYIFLVSLEQEEGKISRIIPFQFKDESGVMQRIAFPKELQIQESLDRWETEFKIEPLTLGKFLAEQLTRRMRMIMISDERILNTFRDVKLTFSYHEEEKQPFFSLDIEAVLKDLNNYSRRSMIFHEDMLYLLTLSSREFVEVIRSYRFGEYDFLRLNLAQDPTAWILGREDLELFRRKKIDLQGLIAVPKL